MADRMKNKNRKEDQPSAYLARLLESWLNQDADFGLLVTDQHLTIRFCNTWLQRHLPDRGACVEDRSLLEVFPELRRSRLEHYYREALEGQTRVLTQEAHGSLLALVPQGGTTFTAMIQTARVYPLVHDGKIEGTVTVIVDVTERIAQETRLRDLLERQKDLIDALNHETRVNQEMAELSQALISTDCLEDICALVLKDARVLTRSPLGFAGYIDPQTGHLVVPTLSQEALEDCRVDGKPHVFVKAKGLWAWVLEHKASLLTNQVHQDPRSMGLPAGHLPISRFLAAPALLDNRLVGQVAVANATDGYTQKDLRGSDIPARMGGDEFAVLAIESRRRDAPSLVAKLQDRVAAHNRSAARPYVLSVSLGADFYDPRSGSSLDDVLNRADRLMYQEKEKKRRGAALGARRRTAEE